VQFLVIAPKKPFTAIIVIISPTCFGFSFNQEAIEIALRRPAGGVAAEVFWTPGALV
jgi:hypothetical protein